MLNNYIKSIEWFSLILIILTPHKSSLIFILCTSSSNTVKHYYPSIFKMTCIVNIIKLVYLWKFIVLWNSIYAYYDINK